MTVVVAGFQGSISCGGQYHFHMETQTAVAIPQEDGGLLIYSATQAPDYIVRSVSSALNLTAGKVRVEVKSVGGAYGGKATRSAHAAVACAVAASLLGLPVRTQVRTYVCHLVAHCYTYTT